MHTRDKDCETKANCFGGGPPAWISDAIAERVAQIAHELNNPLTTIVGNAQRILHRENAGEYLHEATQILREAERASGIVRQLLNLPRETHPDLHLVALNELVESTVELHKNSLGYGHVRVELELGEALPFVRADRGQLQQVLLNLLQNGQQAIEESGEGSLLTVRTKTGRPGWMELVVQDDGPGVPESIRGRIFEPYFTTKPPGKGTGLGLAIARSFVRHQGGTIRLSSPAHGGALFIVELPAAAKERTHDREVQYRQFSADATSAIGANRMARILVVEDEPTVAALIGDVLRDEGMYVDVLSDGQAALDLARRAPFDLVICDVKMPGMDGQDFFTALQQTQSPLRERILFVTGDGVAPRTREFLAKHRLPYLEKPFRVEELSLAVRRLLWGERAAAHRAGA